jgi:hypothetical protein
MQERIVRFALLVCALSTAAAVSRKHRRRHKCSITPTRGTHRQRRQCAPWSKAVFHSLDRGQKGYLSNDDVSADPFLAKNYPIAMPTMTAAYVAGN